jgi:hypothetical protein
MLAPGLDAVLGNYPQFFVKIELIPARASDFTSVQ